MVVLYFDNNTCFGGKFRSRKMDGYTNVQKVVSKYWRSCFGCTSRCLVIQMTVTSDLHVFGGEFELGES